MSDLDALLDAAKERKTAEPDSRTHEVLIGEDVWTLRFDAMDSRAWGDVTAANPLRPDSPIDRRYGYDFNGAARSAAPLCGVRVVDGKDESLTPAQWEKVFDIISGGESNKIASDIFEMNDFAPAQRLATRKKALAAAQKQKRPLLEK